MEADRILKPLQEARAPIDELDSYESPAALAEALRATWLAVERTLRGLLRADASAPDAIRMRALSAEQMPWDAVMAELRRRDLVSLQLAGELHALQQAVARAQDENAVRAADADVARDVVRRVRREVMDRVRSGAEPAERPEEAAAAPAADDGWTERDLRALAASAPFRRVALLAGSALLIVVLLVVGVHMFGRPSEMEQGIAAFEEGRAGVAERHFRAALEAAPHSVTARLYLARIAREQGRWEDAASLLREAAAADPRDGGVRRELGWLFLDLQQPQAAAEQFRQATELEPESTPAWVGLIQSLRLADDPSADDVFRRAPEEARAVLSPARTP